MDGKYKEQQNTPISANIVTRFPWERKCNKCKDWPERENTNIVFYRAVLAEKAKFDLKDLLALNKVKYYNGDRLPGRISRSVWFIFFKNK